MQFRIVNNIDQPANNRGSIKINASLNRRRTALLSLFEPERHRMCGQVTSQRSCYPVPDCPGGMSNFNRRKWYAVFTAPLHERAVANHLDIRSIESFLPIYDTVRLWKNRQKLKISFPLFPSYLFVHINSSDRSSVLQVPGVLQIVGNGRESTPLPDCEIELLRMPCYSQQIEPYRDLLIGERVRIKNGPMRDVQGTLVRKNSGVWFVLTLELINQHAAIHINAEDLEPVAALA